MNWTDLNGTELLRRVFSTPLPIAKVSLMEVHINRNGPTIRLEFDLINQIPDCPPKKWIEAKFNRCRLGINCASFKELEISGIEGSNIVNVNIKRLDDGFINVHFFNDETKIQFSCTDLVVVGPSVYIDAGSSAI